MLHTDPAATSSRAPKKRKADDSPSTHPHPHPHSTHAPPPTSAGPGPGGAVPSAAPSGAHHHQHHLVGLPNPSTAALEEVRPYRSRKSRPCDLCRSRKSRCVVFDAGAPCYLCGLNGRACTFLKGTTKRKRPPPASATAATAAAGAKREEAEGGADGKARAKGKKGKVEEGEQSDGDEEEGEEEEEEEEESGSEESVDDADQASDQPGAEHGQERRESSSASSAGAKRPAMMSSASTGGNGSGGADFLLSKPKLIKRRSTMLSPVTATLAGQQQHQQQQAATAARRRRQASLGGATSSSATSTSNASPGKSSSFMPALPRSASQRSWGAGAGAEASSGFHALINAIVTGEEEEDDEGEKEEQSRDGKGHERERSAQSQKRGTEAGDGSGAVGSEADGAGADSAAEPHGEQSATATNGTFHGGETKPTPFVVGSSSSTDPILQQVVHSYHDTRRSSSSEEHHDDDDEGDAHHAAHHHEPQGAASASHLAQAPTGFDASSARNGAASSTSSASENAIKAPLLPPLEIRRVTQDTSSKSVFFAFVENPYSQQGTATASTTIGKAGFEKLKAALRPGRRKVLMEWYATRDAAAFPILAQSQRRAYREAVQRAAAKPDAAGEEPAEPEIPLPTLLAHATLATASVYDTKIRPISRQAWADNLHALKQQFDFTSTLTLQVALTDLTGRPSINMSGNFRTISQAYALAHMLGLHIDCSTWKFSKDERDLRIRIWWALLIHDKMSSLCWGTPSMISRNDFTTPLPNRRNSPCMQHLHDDDLHSFQFESCYEIVPNTHTPGDTFVALAKLTLVLDEILRDFHSTRSNLPEKDAFYVAKKVKAFMLELEDWKDGLASTLRDVFDELPSHNPPRENDDARMCAAWKTPGTSECAVASEG